MQHSSFVDIWRQIEKLHILPSQAIEHVPCALSDDSKKKLARRTPDDVVIIVSSIDEINSGSVKTIDELVRQRLDKGSKLC